MTFKIYDKGITDGAGRTSVIPVYSWAIDPEVEAILQMKDVALLPCIFKQAAWMPDGHRGYGMPIGGVAALKDAVCPNMVGKDIGCGMIAVHTNIKASTVTRDDLIAIRRLIKKHIPVGEGNVHKESPRLEDPFWGDFGELYEEGTEEGTAASFLNSKQMDWVARSMGTLGGGK